MDKPSFKNVKDMLLCGILSSENVDSSGEIVSLRGMDISSLEAGEGVANYEHLGASDGQGREVVGRIVYVKKIFNASDCDDDDERFFFKETRNKPYLFGIIRLADGAGHHEAQDLAAHIRDHVAHNEDVLLRYSIEGSTVEKEDNRIKTSIARKVAMTFGPANKAVKNKILADPNAPEGFEKIAIAKSEIMQDPTCKPIGGAVVLKYNPILGANRNLQKTEETPETLLQRLTKNIASIRLLKALTAGSTEGAPGTLTGGSALQREDLPKIYPATIAAATRDYGDEPWDRNRFKKHLKKYLAKASLPEISDSFLEHFTSIAEASKLKKSIDDLAKMALIHNDPEKPMTVYRVQNEEGRGPYSLSWKDPNGDKVREALNSTPWSYQTYPQQDFINKEWRDNPEQELGHLKFAFASPKHADKWFGGDGLAKLSELGFKVAPVKATKVYRSKSGRQLAFIPHSSETKLQIAKSDFGDFTLEPLNKKESTNPVLSSPNESVIEDDRTNIPEAIPTNLTFRGKKIKKNPGVKGISLDINKGMLTTPYGSLKLHNPATESPEIAQHFQNCLNSPHTHKIMSQALKGWHQVHQLNKAGELPEEIPMTATILSTCSGNRPVPLTELQTVRIVDAMKNSGIDIRKPGFENIMPHLKQLDKPDVLPVTGGEAIGKDPAYFIGNKIGVERDLFGNKAGEANVSGRYPGELKTITPLLEDTVKNLSEYYKAHKGLVDLVNKHKTSMASGIRELMGMKQARTNWNNRRRSVVASGKPDPGEYKGLNIPGIKLKTGLYAYGMMGGGDSIVPDTHFIRHMFGLDTHKDAKTLLYLKKALWNPSNYHIIEKYNDWYRKHHPAHKWMVNHPEFSKMFEKPEDATFPAFWANWMNIPAYEAKLGTSYGKQAHNAGSTHAPYWDAIAPHVNQALTRLGKSEDFDTTMPLRAALIMQQYVKDYGEVPAQLLYYQHLVPKLLECAKNRQDSADANNFLRKALKLEEGLIELRKDIRHVTEGGHSIELPEVYRVNMHENGKSYPAGRFMTNKGQLHHLEDYHGLLNSMVPEGPINATTISRIHGLMASPHFDVQEHKVPEGEPEIDSKVANVPSVPQVSVEKQPEPKRAGVFSYFRPGMSKPHTVEFGPNGAALDGKALTNDKLALMLENARKGLAQVKWNTGGDLAKREATEDLMGQTEALQHIRAAVQAGHIHPSVERALTKHIFEDPMVEGVGNKFAAQEFRKQNKPGIYASIDLNDFKHVNDVHGHDQGDEAIKALGNALRTASQKVGTTKVYRPGGD